MIVGRVKIPRRSSKHLELGVVLLWTEEGQLTRCMTSNTGEYVRTEDGIGRREEVEDFEESFESLKQEKAKAKSASTQSRGQLFEMVEEMDLPNRCQVRFTK